MSTEQCDDLGTAHHLERLMPWHQDVQKLCSAMKADT